MEWMISLILVFAGESVRCLKVTFCFCAIIQFVDRDRELDLAVAAVGLERACQSRCCYREWWNASRNVDERWCGYSCYLLGSVAV